jgi:IS30 family transposase
MKYNHLTVEEREKIQEMLWQKSSIRNIAKILSRSPSSISREINRNIPLQRSYRPRLAQSRALQKRKSRGRKLRLKDGFTRHYVVSKLKQGYSPEQISGRLSFEYPDRKISHEAIYQYVYSCVYRNGWGVMRPHYHDLRPYLKRRHKRRVKKGMRKARRILRAKGPSIEIRPKEIELRKTMGHWEGDSMESKQSKYKLNTLVERKTGLVFITKIKDKTMAETNKAVVSRLSILPDNLHKTLTLDNGTENSGYKELGKAINISCYFAHPYHSWERGTNENTNGLIRWYLPKKTDFAKISEEEIKSIEYSLNTRPRKRLGWRTPLEVFNACLPNRQDSVAVTH